MDYSWITATIAGIVAVIAFLQWVTAREKIVLDLFEKRFAVYEELRSAISYQIRCARIDDEHYFKFARAVSRSKLLFGPENLARVTLPEAANAGQLSDSNRKQAEDAHVARLDRLGNFYDELDTLVLPYMQHTQKKPEWANVLGSLAG